MAATRRTNRLLGLLATSATLLAGATTAHAQETNDGAIQASDEIVVTAQRRETSLQTTAAAVSVVSAEDIENARVRSVEDVAQLAPSLTFSSANSQQQVSIRGIGVDNPFMTAESGVAIYVDGVYLGRPNIGTVALYDLERIEVVRGPQGTLYGRNATGGAVNLITASPTRTPEGRATVSFGNYDAREAGVSLSGPLTNTLSGHIGAFHTTHDGYVRNLFNGRRLNDANDFSARGALEFDPSSDLSFVLRGDYQRISDSGSIIQPYDVTSTAGEDVVQTTFFGGRYTNNPRTVFHDLQDDWDREYRGASLTTTYDLGGATLKSITAYRDSYTIQDADLDGTDGALFDILHNVRPPSGHTEDASQWSQEVQLLSNDSGPLTYTLGAYFYDEDAKVRIIIDQPDYIGGVFRTDDTVSQNTQSLAAYGELYLEPVAGLRFTAGLRYTEDRKSYESTVGTISSDEQTWSSWTPKVGVDYTFSDDLFAYALISRGFKAGGFNGYTNNGPYTPEDLWNYEAGLRWRLFDRRLNLNATAFYYDYSDIQVTQFTFQGPDIANVGSASVLGLELEARAMPTDNLEFGGAATFLNAEYDSFQLTDLLTAIPSDVGGNQIVKSPDLALSGYIAYTLDLASLGSLTARYDVSYRSSFYFSPFNTPGTRQDEAAISNARIAYAPNDNFEIAAYIRNISDEAVFVQATQASALLFPAVAYNPPRTYGVSLTLRY